MKISVIVGSLRKKSYNRSVYNCYRQLAPKEIEFVEVEIKDFPLYNADVENQGIPDVVTKAANLIRSSDGILFFTPEYNYSIPGGLKNALDWLSRLPNHPFSEMKAGVIGASPSQAGTARMQYDLRKVAVFLNMTFMNRPEIMINRCHEKINDQGILTDESTKKFLSKHLEAFIKFCN